MKLSTEINGKVGMAAYPINEKQTHICVNGTWMEICETPEGDFYFRHPSHNKVIYFKIGKPRAAKLR